jgi:hypothetical protein
MRDEVLERHYGHNPLQTRVWRWQEERPSGRVLEEGRQQQQKECHPSGPLYAQRAHVHYDDRHPQSKRGLDGERADNNSWQVVCSACSKDEIDEYKLQWRVAYEYSGSEVRVQ